MKGIAVAIQRAEAKTDSIEKESTGMAAMINEVKQATQKTAQGVQGL